ncbi:MAG TPA: maleylpyruvate isomerase family mycothiol-dependent enzyme [Streptosporangiaceae bacterium]
MTTELAARPAGRPRSRALDRAAAMAAAATEYARAEALLGSITAGQWGLPTDCPGWDVRAIAGHVLGMAQMIATVPELGRQQMAAQRGAKKTGQAMIDVLTALQVAKNADLSPADLVNALHRIAPQAARRRRRMPGFIRSRTMPGAITVGSNEERWTFGFLFDIILTRDPFMHRLDICRATGIPVQATAAHEGVIVDDVVREWAGRHGRPYTLILSGPAGGSWAGHGEQISGEQISMDAFDFCRSVSGRGMATGLLREQVPF